MPEHKPSEMFSRSSPLEEEVDDFDYDSEHVEFVSEIKEYSYGEDDEELMEEEIISVNSEGSSEPAPAPATEPATMPAPAPMAPKPAKKPAAKKAAKPAPKAPAKK